jgi:prepilin-type N-terminal cleavage/methylation domain-containing protein
VKNRAFSILELIIVLVIVAILTTIGVAGAYNWKSLEDKKNTRLILRAIQLAEWDYKIRTETCSDSWKDLEVGNPNKPERLHNFSIVCSPTFVGKACRKRQPSKCMTIDLFGKITEY